MKEDGGGREEGLSFSPCAIDSGVTAPTESPLSLVRVFPSGSVTIKVRPALRDNDSDLCLCISWSHR